MQWWRWSMGEVASWRGRHFSQILYEGLRPRIDGGVKKQWMLNGVSWRVLRIPCDANIVRVPSTILCQLRVAWFRVRHKNAKCLYPVVPDC